jgi:hypothetical protein
MDDYHEFCDAHEVDIEEWCQYWSPNYFSITKGQLVALTLTPSTTIIGVGVGLSTHGGGGNNPAFRGWVLIFNLVINFFKELHTNYQGVKIEKLHTLLEF